MGNNAGNNEFASYNDSMGREYPSPKSSPQGKTNLRNEKPSVYPFRDVKLRVREPMGFANLGNTCFMNSILQTLTHTIPFREFLTNESATTLQPYSWAKINDDMKFLSLVKKYISEQNQNKTTRFSFWKVCWEYVFGKYVSPSELVESYSDLQTDYAKGKQQDSHEFLGDLLKQFEKEILKSLPHVGEKNVNEIMNNNKEERYTKEFIESNPIKRIFYGETIDLVRTGSYRKPIPFWAFSVPCNDISQLTVSDCLDALFKSEESGVKTWIKSSPSILTIHLKRYTISSTTGGLEKIGRRIKFREVIDLRKYMLPGYQSHDKGEALYDLYSINVHEGGSLKSGHYISIVKCLDGHWYSCSDRNVSKISEQNMMKQNPYLLFYVKRNQHHLNQEQEIPFARDDESRRQRTPQKEPQGMINPSQNNFQQEYTAGSLRSHAGDEEIEQCDGYVDPKTTGGKRRRYRQHDNNEEEDFDSEESRRIKKKRKMD